MDIYRVFLLSSILAIFNLFFNQSYAAVLPIAGIDVGQVDPLNMTRTIVKKPIEPLSTDKELVLPVLTQQLDLGQAKQYKFKLKRIKFIGNNVISSDKLRAAYLPYYGKTITLAKILELIQKTTKTYRDEGYVLSQAYLPAQDIDKEVGEITIGVIEGYINEVAIVSDSIPYSTKLLLQQYGERLKKERPITRATLERYILLCDDLPGGDIKAVFVPARNTPGAADLEFVAEDNKIFGAEIYGNNRGTRLLGPDELSTTVHQYNALYGNSTTVNAVRTDAKEMRLFLFNHTQPLNSDGLLLTFMFSRTRTWPDYKALPALTRSDLETPGHSDNIVGQLSYPVVRSRNQNFVVQAKLDGSNSETKFANDTLYRERLRTLRLGFTYDWLDDFVFNILSTSLIGLEFSQGLDALDAYNQDTYSTRPNTTVSYNKVTGTVSRTQPLPFRFYLRLLGQGQYSFNELVSSEEFGYGGRIIGLGYDPFQVAGDHGIAGKAELIYSIPTGEVIQGIKNFLNISHGSIVDEFLTFQPEIFGFYDGGRVWNIEHITSSQKEHDSAVSAGFGIRGQAFKYVSFEGYMAKPMTRVAENETDRQPRYFFSVGISYY